MISALQYAVHHIELIDAAYNGVQAGCIRRANSSPRFFSFLNGWKRAFLLADLSSLAWTGCHALRLTVEKIGLLKNIGYLGTGAFVVLSAAWVSGMVSKLSRKEVHQALNLPHNVPNISIINSGHESLKRLLLATRAVTNLALAVLFPYNPLYLLSAGLELYTLILLVQRTWVRFSREEPFISDDRDVDQVQLRYDFLIRKGPGPIPDDQKCCAICWEDMQPAEATHFCEDHFFHISCLVGAIQKKMDLVTSMLHITNRRPLLSIPVYSATLDEGAEPNCPACRKPAPGHEFRISVYDHPSQRWRPAQVLK